MAPKEGTFLANGISRKYPTFREKEMLGTVDDWLDGKRADDGAEGLWRIHDDLYDLTNWINIHPGGRDWLQLTKGTDITEAFETHHLNNKPELMLPKFHVRKAKTLRNSLLTFHNDGFYKTLKRRLNQVLPETGPTLQSKIMTDSFFVLSILTGVLATWWSWKWAVLSGLFLQMCIVASHNFFHMKDNWRMYYFNLSLMSYRDWRVSHALSHHLFPNTILDLEISMWEPIFRYLPEKNKSMMTRFLPWIVSPLVFTSIFHLQFIRRMVNLIMGKKNQDKEEAVGFLFPVVLMLLGGSDLLVSIQMWTVIVLVSSFLFGIIGLTAAHHHPDIYHEGDHLGEDKDFGFVQLAAVRDRTEVTGPLLVLVTFGDHALHHLFPTVDHGRLSALYPVFEETCKEFNIKYRSYPLWEMIKGMYKQLARNYINTKVSVRPVESTSK